MKIGVLVKQVPDTETKIRVVGDGSGIETGDIKWIVNPYDEYAVEEALKLKQSEGGEVVIFSLGPDRAQEAIRTALAMGAERGVHVVDEPNDPWITASKLAAAIQGEAPDILFAGRQAVDDDAVQVPVMVAELLGWPHVSSISTFAIADGKVTANRVVGGGVTMVTQTALPGMFTCDKSLNEPRYASLPGIMKARRKPIARPDGLPDSEPLLTLSNFRLPEERPGGRIIGGESVGEKVSELVRLLREEAKVI
ncbi:MAG: electron transfer flavoprotein subunit beta/FixA family protein [Myxococcota bacterium]|nr:electron transfer flavoprotein subunit beta/FixA family protein [Myxococcota bacterium]